MPSPPSNYRFTRRLGAALLGMGILFAPAPAAATTAVFFPKGSSAKVDRHHVTVSLSATGTVAWDAVDIGGDKAADVGLLVAVKAGGRIEVTARVWIDVIEQATSVIVSRIPSATCKSIGAQGGAGTPVEGDSGRSSSGGGSGESSGGCSGEGSGSGSGESSSGCNSCSSNDRADGGAGGGCVSSSSDNSGGCGGCGSCKPSENGHPGCSAFATPAAGSGAGCGPLDPNDDSSSGSLPRPDGSTSAPRVGPYEVLKVGAADGSARRWLDENGYEAGASFDEAAAAVERDGYSLFAVRAQPPTSSSIVQSLRVITTSPAAALPLRMFRMGASSSIPGTPITLVTLASTPQQLAATTVQRIDVARLASSGSGSNYESLVSTLLGVSTADAGSADAGGSDAGGSDAGGQTSRWLVESTRTVSNRLTPKSSGEAGSGESATLADLFRSQCGEKRSAKHAVCALGDEGDAGEPDAGVADAGADADAGPSADAGTDAGELDAGDEPDASTSTCPEVDRQQCDDIDLAIPPNSSLIATRFRGVIAGDAVFIGDLEFTASLDPLPDGRYVVRDDGQPGLCERGASSDDPSTTDDDAQTCKQTAARTRPWSSLNLGPLFTLLLAIRTVSAIMKRAKRGARG